MQHTPVKIYIDGNQGTTGLKIVQRLEQRSNLQLLTLEEAYRKDPVAKKEIMNQADLVFLCLPDAAARDSVALIDNPKVKVLDTSTAHRVSPDWQYGFPELSDRYRQNVIHGNRVAVPGCHASGFLALVHPLTAGGFLKEDATVFCHSITGYSGGGKAMIAQYEAERTDFALNSPRQYGIAQTHKHLPEMRQIGGLHHDPIFTPIVGDFYSGMTVTVPLSPVMLQKQCSVEAMRAYFTEYYQNQPLFHVYSEQETEAVQGFVAANAMSGTDGMEILVAGNDERMLLIARFDNLGKGASGAAIQCMNLMLGCPETEGLVLPWNTEKGDNT